MLYVITERWPLARKYRDVFERIKEAVWGIMAQGEGRKHISRTVVDGSAGLMEQGILGNASLDLEVMIGDMIGDSSVATGAGFEDFDFRDVGVGNEWDLMNVVEPGQGEEFGDSWGAVGRL
jgi:hypothetical protein